MRNLNENRSINNAKNAYLPLLTIFIMILNLISGRLPDTKNGRKPNSNLSFIRVRKQTNINLGFYPGCGSKWILSGSALEKPDPDPTILKKRIRIRPYFKNQNRNRPPFENRIQIRPKHPDPDHDPRPRFLPYALVVSVPDRIVCSVPSQAG